MLRKPIIYNAITGLMVAVIGFLTLSLACYWKKDRIPSHHQLLQQYHHEVSAIIKQASCYLQFRLTQNHRMDHPHRLAIVVDIDRADIPYLLALCHYAQDHGVTVFFRPSPDFCGVSFLAQEYPFIRSEGYDIVMAVGNRESMLDQPSAGMVFELPPPFYT